MSPPGRSPGSRVCREHVAARRPAFPGYMPSGFWDWLPGYSGGTAPAFDRLPSKALSGATAADFFCQCADYRFGRTAVKAAEDGAWCPPVR